MGTNKHHRFKRSKSQHQTDGISNPMLSRAVRQGRTRRSASSNKKLEYAQEADPKHSSIRILRDWTDGALQEVWAFARSNHVKSMIDVKLELRGASQLPSTDRDACYHIVQHTSMADYQSSTIGWNPALKKNEMADPGMLYILIRAAPVPSEAFAPSIVETDILGFASFKIDNDDPPYERRTIVYIYEVHIGRKFRGKGLGKFLVSTVEAMAEMANISKTMLTVFNANKNAIGAYERMGYQKDEASPHDREIRGRVIKAEYMIMGKMWSSTGSSIEV